MDHITTKLENEIIINSVVGDVTVDDLIDHVIENMENWIGKPVLWELSKANLNNISTQEWEGIIQKIGHLSQERKGEKTALVSLEDFPFGILRMFEIIAENKALAIHFQTFREIKKAKKWLLEKDK